MNLNTQDLAETRDNLKQQILDDFIENFPQYEEITECFEDIRFEEEEIESWKSGWQKELEEIEEIDTIENECIEFSFGETLIYEHDFESYCQELCEEIGYLPKELPSFISFNINWEGVADDLRGDYSEVDYQGRTYLFRA